MNEMLRHVLYAGVLTALLAVFAGFGYLFYHVFSDLLSPKRLLKTTAHEHRASMLEICPPGSCPEKSVDPPNDFGVEMWEYLVEEGLATRADDGYRLVEWGPPGGEPATDGEEGAGDEELN